MPFRVGDALCVNVRANLLISFCLKARDFHSVCKKRKIFSNIGLSTSGWFMCCTVIHLICVHGTTVILLKFFVWAAEKIAITLADVFYLKFTNQYNFIQGFSRKCIGWKRNTRQRISNNFNYVAIK